MRRKRTFIDEIVSNQLFETSIKVHDDNVDDIEDQHDYSLIPIDVTVSHNDDQSAYCHTIVDAVSAQRVPVDFECLYSKWYR